ncbi:putative ribosome biogenesis GTPase RsgA [Clostridia bacterium]|nr:putative ribosome biogenesis GTPase RsgA [Clostridia bacterium]
MIQETRQKGRIQKGIAGFYEVRTENEIIYQCKAKGIFRKNKQVPLVGDFVAFEILDEKEKKGNIVELFSRKNELFRPPIANVDQVFLFSSLSSPRTNFSLLDRILIFFTYQNIPVSIIFNKEDMVSEEEKNKMFAYYRNTSYPIWGNSSLSNENKKEHLALLKGKTTAFVGVSGVGKSTFTNRFFTENKQETGALSKNQRGKQTTRHSELLYIDQESIVVDTPGFSFFSFTEIFAQDLASYYPEYQEKKQDCHFLGCVHVHEPKCKIKEMVAQGIFSKERYQNYCKLYEERRLADQMKGKK